MPNGTMLWFDTKTGAGRITASGREYPVADGEVEPGARAAGARVHFDVERVDGVATAVRVALREGTRSATGQRRFGSLAGVARPEEKGRAALSHQRGATTPLYPGQPVSLVRHWIRAADSGHVDGLLPLYAPQAVLHTPTEDHHGRGAIRRYLLDSGLLSRGWSARPFGRGDDVCAVRQRTATDAGRTSRFRIAHGQIVEHWDEPPVARDG
jgi:cold shock CspA family protein